MKGRRALVPVLTALLLGPAAIATSAQPAGATTGPSSVFHALAPVEAFSTGFTPLQSGSPRTVALTGVVGVPASGVTALAGVVQVIAPTATANLNLTPEDSTPLTLRVAAGVDASVGVTLPLAATGNVKLAVTVGTVGVVINLTGYWTEPGAGPGSIFHPLSTTRAYASPSGQLSASAPQTANLAGQGGLPASGVTAVAVTVQLGAPTQATVLQLNPTDLGSIVAVRASAGQTATASLVLPLGAGEQVGLTLTKGQADVAFDITGYWSDANAGAGKAFFPLSPVQVASSQLSAGSSNTVALAGANGIPASGVASVPLVLRLTSPTSAGTLTITALDKPPISFAYSASPATTLSALVKLPTNGQLGLSVSSGSASIVVVATGYAIATATSLAVDVLGLPSAVSGAVTVTGPNGFNRSVGATTTLSGLAPGAYHVAAASMHSGSVTYYPTVTGATINLVSAQLGIGSADYTDTVPDTTKAIPTAALKGVATNGDNTRTLTLDGADPVVASLVVGNFVATGVSSALPDGLIGKVTQVAPGPSGTRLVTVADTTLLDALPRAALEAAGNLSASDVASSGAPTRVLRAGDLSARNASSTSPITQGILKHLSCGASGSIDVGGSLSVVPHVDIQVKWGLSGLRPTVKTARVSGSVVETAQLQATAHAGANCTLGKTPLLAQPIRLTPIEFLVGPVPVEVSPELQFYLSASGTVSADLSAAVTQQFNATAGIGFDKGNVYPIAGRTNTFTYTKPSPRLQAHVGADLSGELSLLIYGVAGPQATLTGGLALDVVPSQTPWWKLTASLKGSSALVVPLLRLNQSLPGVLSFTRLLASSSTNTSGTITTLAGNGTSGYAGDGGPATDASLNGPRGVDVDGTGNVYIADATNNRIRRVNPSGVITTVAGNGSYGYGGDGGPAVNAELSDPSGVAVDTAGNLYIADTFNSRIRKVNSSGIITTVAGNGTSGSAGDGGPATAANLSQPYDVALDAAGNLYIADFPTDRIRKVNPSGIITTVAGNGTDGYAGDGGPATAANLSGPVGVNADDAGNLYIADYFNERIRKVNSSGIITTVAGPGNGVDLGDGGPATDANLSGPFGVDVDSSGNLYIADDYNSRIRKVDPSGIIDTVAGNGTPGYAGDGGPATAASLSNPLGVAVDGSGSLYVADWDNGRIRKVT